MSPVLSFSTVLRSSTKEREVFTMNRDGDGFVREIPDLFRFHGRNKMVNHPVTNTKTWPSMGSVCLNIQDGSSTAPNNFNCEPPLIDNVSFKLNCGYHSFIFSILNESRRRHMENCTPIYRNSIEKWKFSLITVCLARFQLFLQQMRSYGNKIVPKHVQKQMNKL